MAPAIASARPPSPITANIASQGRYVIGEGMTPQRNEPAHFRLTRSAGRPDQGLPGLGENSLALSDLSFHSSASAGGSPLRVMFGHSAA